MNDLKNKVFPTNPEVRDVAIKLYELVSELPIISPHGHVDPQLLSKNEPFDNPSELFIFKDHYVTRLLHSNGVDLNSVLTGADPRKAWEIFYQNYFLLAGTASAYWFEHILQSLFGISDIPSIENANRHYDLIASHLLEPEMLPKSLADRFKLKILATTDDPIDDLAEHRKIAADSSFSTKVVPTFRPDKYLDPRLPNWSENIEKLLQSANQKSTDYKSYIKALENRRRVFKENGAFSADHGVSEPYTCELTEELASEIFSKALNKSATQSELRDFAGHMLMEMARMSCEDGLVMTIHAGVFRNHSDETFEKHGADTGHDIPISCEWTKNLHPLLNRYGLNKNLQIILFSLDETNWSREIAPLAGFYPSVYIGIPWWFLDSPNAIYRFREATVDIAGFYRGSGFIDDTRAFLSIPARHDLSRRVDASYLAELVCSGRLTMKQAEKIAIDLVTAIPSKAFKL
jgi:glucuronate isomerase